jgi:hypothetical protein
MIVVFVKSRQADARTVREELGRLWLGYVSSRASCRERTKPSLTIVRYQLCIANK